MKNPNCVNMTKNGRGRHVPLSQAAMDIIGQLPKYNGCPWLLPNPQTMLPFSDFKRSFMQARKLAGLDDVHIHDLRHSYASALAGSGVDLYTIGKLLGHVNVANDAIVRQAQELVIAADDRSKRFVENRFLKNPEPIPGDGLMRWKVP